MKRRALRTRVVLAGVAVVVVIGSAIVGAQMGSGDVVAERQRLMKLNGASLKDIQDKAKAGNTDAIAVNAETIARNAREITALFPEGSLKGETAAKPEIWQRWSEFEADAKNLQVEAEKLRDASRSKNAEQTLALVKDFPRNACAKCHQPFR